MVDAKSGREHLAPMPNNEDTTYASRRWLLLIQQLPTRPSRARLKTWRRLQQIGSVVLKNSVYVLPHTAQAREDFEWLAAEIRASSGQASILVAEALTAEQETEICEAFRRARGGDYDSVRLEARELARKIPHRLSGAARQPIQRSLKALRDEFARIQAIDFCGAPTRAVAEEALDALAAKLTSGGSGASPAGEGLTALHRAKYQRRSWVTRPRPGVDRMASAWLIRRFIDPHARFRFTSAEIANLAKREIPFDMYGAECGHHGDLCTFETMCDRFGIEDATARYLGTIVHDIDLKDQAYNSPESPVIATVIQGLQATYPDDQELLQHGMALFAALYQALAQTNVARKAIPRRPQPNATKRPRRRR